MSELPSPSWHKGRAIVRHSQSGSLMISIPSVPLKTLNLERIVPLIFSLFWYSFLVVWDSLVIFGIPSSVGAGIKAFFVLFSLPFWFFGLLPLSEVAPLEQISTAPTDFVIGEYAWTLNVKSKLPWKRRKLEGSTESLLAVSCESSEDRLGVTAELVLLLEDGGSLKEERITVAVSLKEAQALIEQIDERLMNVRLRRESGRDLLDDYFDRRFGVEQP